MAECEESYGFLPCSTTLGGSIFLMITYGYILLQGANLLSNGSELLLEVLSPGVIGGLVLPILGALPDSLIIIFSGMGGSREEAQEQVAVGVGTLAGSTIMLLTIALAGSLMLGKCDLDENGEAIDRRLTRSSWRETGVTTDQSTVLNAGIMVASCALFLSVQVPTLLGFSHSPKAALWGGITCFVMLGVYCAYQVGYPELQRRRMERARKRRLKQLRTAEALHRFAEPLGGLFTNGVINQDVVAKLFTNLDTDNNGTIDEVELRAFLTGLALNEGSDSNEINQDVAYWMSQLDSDHSGQINLEEFTQQLESWIRSHHDRHHLLGLEDGAASDISNADNETQLLVETPDDDDDDDDDEHAKVLSRSAILLRSSGLMALGAALCAIFSDPMVAAVNNFSQASHIPSFFIAFIVTPLASNSSELVSSLNFAAKKRKKNISLTFSQVYGAVTMNNTMCLGLFLMVVYLQDLSWTYTSEVVIIVGTTLITGVLGLTRYTWKAWLAFPVILLYPLAVVLVYVFDYLLKWDG